MIEQTAKDIMSAPAVTVGPDTSMEEAAGIMLEEDLGSLLVVDDRGQLVGIVTDSDFSAREAGVPFSAFRAPQLLGRWLGKEGVSEIFEEARERPVAEIMTGRVHTVEEDDSLRTILDVMLEHDVKHVPVVGPEGPVGMVARHDLLRLLHRRA